MGRPKIDIDEKEVEKLASFGCTDVEIAAFFSVSQSTVRDRLGPIVAKGRENGKVRLRKRQIEMALGGNVAMLIWLGKQMLGQQEKVEVKSEINTKLSMRKLLNSEKKYYAVANPTSIQKPN